MECSITDSEDLDQLQIRIQREYQREVYKEQMADDANDERWYRDLISRDVEIPND